MPNYSLLINSQFKPYSFEELIKPYQIYGEAYKEQERRANELYEKAGNLASQLNENLDPELTLMYNDYINQLKDTADSLATKGMSVDTVNNVQNLTKRYNLDIKPIEKAAEARTEESKMQRAAKMNNPSLIFERDADRTPLSYYYKNTNPASNPIDGNAVRQNVANMAQVLSKQMNEMTPSELKSVFGDKVTYEYIQHHGFTEEQVMKAILDAPDAPEALKSIVNKAVSATGVDSWNNEEAKNIVTDYAKQGLWSAVGEDKSNIITNSAEAAKQNAALSVSAQVSAARKLMELNDYQELELDDNIGKVFTEKKIDNNKKVWFNNKTGKFYHKDSKGNFVIAGFDEDLKNLLLSYYNLSKVGTNTTPYSAKELESMTQSASFTYPAEFIDDGYMAAGETSVHGVNKDSKKENFRVKSSNIINAEKNKIKATQLGGDEVNNLFVENEEIRNLIISAASKIGVTFKSGKDENGNIVYVPKCPEGSELMMRIVRYEDDKGNSMERPFIKLVPKHN